jgi:MFS family permease
LIALISAAPLFGYISGFVWARATQGRPKVAVIVALQILFLMCVVGVALLPASRAGGYLLVLLMVAARLLLGGVITVRSLVWTLNYPSEVRGKVTSRLALVAAPVVGTTSLIGSVILDMDAHHFRLVYVAAACIAAIGVMVFSRIKLVEEEAQLSLEREGSEPGGADGNGGARSDSMWRVLRDDPLYSRYLGWQFVLGVSNMLVEAPLIYLVSRQLSANYLVSIAVTTVIPFGLAVLAMPFWGAYLDRVHITRFRTRHSWVFTASQVVIAVGAFYGSLAVLAMGRVVLGFARGGGMLAWQIGHNDFAPQRSVGLYMGAHATLTGIRGLFAPFLGMLLYLGWSPIAIAPLGVTIPGFVGIGASLWAVAALLSAASGMGFITLRRQILSQRSGEAVSGKSL